MSAKVFMGVFLLACMVLPQNMWSQHDKHSKVAFAHHHAEVDTACCEHQTGEVHKDDQEACCDSSYEFADTHKEHPGCEDNSCRDSSCCITVYSSSGVVFDPEGFHSNLNIKPESHFGLKIFYSSYYQMIWNPPKITFIG